MSLHPSAHLVFGIHDDNGTLIDPDILAETTISHDILFGNNPPSLAQCFFAPKEGGVPTIAGLQIDSIGDQDTLRAILFCFPEQFSTNGIPNNGWREFPLAHSLTLYRNRMSEQVPDHQMYANGMCYMVPDWRVATQQAFDKLGLPIDPDKLKLMLVWEWT